jgi:N-acetylglucosamine-6-sulfatase
MTRRVRCSLALAVLVAAGACAADDPLAPTAYAGRATNAGTLASVAAAAGGKNILLFVLDDAARQDMNDSTITPEMHRWVKRVGIAFTRYYSNSALCSTARATILSMLYQHNHHVAANVGSNGGARAFNDAVTIATAFQSLGWVTMLIAKYLNELGYLDGGAYIPPGWDHWQAMNLHSKTPGLAMRYWNYGEAYRPYGDTATRATLIQHGTTPNEWQPRYFSAQFGAALANLPAGKPFFAIVAPLGPHAPAKPEAQDVGSCDHRPLYRPTSYNEADVSDQPLVVRRIQPWSATRIAAQDSTVRVACETLRGTDRAFGAMMRDLEASGRLANTCIAIISDQGIQNGEHRLDYKAVLYEETVNVDLWMTCPGAIAGPLPRVDSTHVVSTVDLMSSFLDLAGFPNAIPHNGVSLLPLLANANLPASAHPHALIENPDLSDPANRASAVVTIDYKYVKHGNGDVALYALPGDETVNLATVPAFAAKKSQLAALLAQLKTH